MKLEKKSIIAVTFVISFVVLLLFSLLTSGFRVDIKGIVVAIYFSLWVTAAAFVILTYIIPFIQDKREEKKTRKTQPGQDPGAVPTPFRSPRSGLPVRERIAAYVAERRREDGLPAPEPIRPSQVGTAVPPSPAVSASASAAAPVVTSAGKAEGDDLGEIPLPDDFGAMDDGMSGEMGSLPGLDDDLSGGYGNTAPDSAQETGEDLELPSPAEDLPDDVLPGFDGDLEPDLSESDLVADDGMMDVSGDDISSIDEDTSSPSPSGGGLSEEGLPDLDGDLEPDLSESDLMADDGMMDVSGDDISSIDEDTSSPSPSGGGLSEEGLPDLDGDLEPDLSESDLMADDGMMDVSGDDISSINEDTSSPSPSGGGLSEEGLPDLDGGLEPDILDTDLSGDEDLGDIEFMDLEPDEPKKEKK